MKDKILPKKSMIFAQQLGSSNLLDEAHTILSKHNITYSDNQIINTTPNQWKQLVRKKVNVTIDRELMVKCSQKSKLQDKA